MTWFVIACLCALANLEVMKTTAFFIIRPKPELALRVKDTDLEGTPFESESVLWACGLADRASWTRAEVEDGVILAFLFHLKADFLSAGEIELLGLGEKVKRDVFEQYWTLESYFGVDQAVENVVVTGAGRSDFPTTNGLLSALRRNAIEAPPGTAEP